MNFVRILGNGDMIVTERKTAIYADYQIGNTSYIVRFVFQVSTYGETSLTAFVHE